MEGNGRQPPILTRTSSKRSNSRVSFDLNVPTNEVDGAKVNTPLERTFYLSETQSEGCEALPAKLSDATDVFYYEVTTALKGDGSDDESSNRKDNKRTGEKSSPLRRQGSVVIRVRPGETFTSLAPVVVDNPAKCDPRLGTLGELRHLLNSGTPSQVTKGTVQLSLCYL